MENYLTKIALNYYAGHAAGCHSKDRAYSFTNGQSLDLVSTHKGKPRLSVFEMFYNMTALLASVALGYDVRTSNGFLLHKRCFKDGSILQITSSPRITAPTRNIFTDDADEDEGDLNKALVKYTSNHGLFESTSRNFNNSQDTYHMNSGLEDSGAFSNNYTQSSSKLKPAAYLVAPHRRNLSESLNTHDVYLPIVDNNLIQAGYAEEDWYYRSRKNFYPMLSNIASTNPFAREMHHSDTYGSNYFSSSLQTNDSIERGYNSYPDYRTQPEPAPRNYTFQNALQQNNVDEET